jgi:hypothetical protein
MSPGHFAPAAEPTPRFVSSDLLIVSATPEDITEACLALIATRYATGQTFLVDGGLGLAI